MIDEPTMQEILFALKVKCHEESLFLADLLQEAGAAAAGTMSSAKFKSAIVGTFRTFHFTEQLLNVIVAFYGCGYKAPSGTARDVQASYEMVEWKCFCDDVESASLAGSGAASVALKYFPRFPRGCDSFVEAEASRSRNKSGSP